MSELAGGLPLVRLALSPGVKNLAVLRETDPCVLEIAGILPQGKLAETSHIVHHFEQRISVLKWASDTELLLSWEEKNASRLSLYRLEASSLLPVLSTTIDVPVKILAASSYSGSLEILLAISTKQGTRFAVFFPHTSRYQMISQPWVRATFGVWHPQERLLGINVAQTATDERFQGILYRYGDSADQLRMLDLSIATGRPCTINACDKETTLYVTSSSEDGSQLPGSYSLKTGETQWFEQVGWSASVTAVSHDGELVLCGGLVEADWRYVIVNRSNGSPEELIPVEDALLLDPVFCQDARYLLCCYQTPAIPPTLCHYDRQTHACELLLNSPGLDRAPQIQAHHRWARCSILDRLPLVSFSTHSTDYQRIVFFLHGGPHLNIMKSYSPLLSRLVEQGFWVVAPNFPGSIGYGAAYEQMTRGDWGGQDVQSVIELAELLTSQGSERFLAIYGVSYGGYLALLAAGLRPDLWSCVIAGAPILDLQDLYANANQHVKESLRLELGRLLENQAELAARSPITYIRTLSQLPMLLLHGADDTICPTRQSRRFAEILSSQGEQAASFAYHEFPHLKHELYSERFWAESVIRFLAQYSSDGSPSRGQSLAHLVTDERWKAKALQISPTYEEHDGNYRNTDASFYAQDTFLY